MNKPITNASTIECVAAMVTDVRVRLYNKVWEAIYLLIGGSQNPDVVATSVATLLVDIYQREDSVRRFFLNEIEYLVRKFGCNDRELLEWVGQELITTGCYRGFPKFHLEMLGRPPTKEEVILLAQVYRNDEATESNAIEIKLQNLAQKYGGTPEVAQLLREHKKNQRYSYL